MQPTQGQLRLARMAAVGALVILAWALVRPIAGPDLAWLRNVRDVGPLLLALVAALGFFGLLLLLIFVPRAALDVARRVPPFPAYAVLATLALVLGTYAWSNIDWLQVPFVGDTTKGGVPSLDALLLPIGLLAAVLAANLLAQAQRLEQRYLARGVAPEQAAQARSLALGGAKPLALGAGASLGLAFVFTLAKGAALPDKLPVIPSVLLFPFLGVALVLGLAWLGRKGFAGLRSSAARPGWLRLPSRPTRAASPDRKGT